MTGLRYIQVVSALPGRTRLRLPWLHGGAHDDEATRLADELSRLAGMKEVEIRAYTGSVLCVHDPDRLDAGALLAHVSRVTGVAETVAEGDPLPPVPGRRGDGPGNVAREVARLFRHIDDRVLTVTDGKVDMGTLATFAFLGAGALNVAFQRQAPAPPWFNLAWWGIRTFMTFEADAVVGPDGGGDGSDE